MASRGVSQMLVFQLVATWAVSTRLESQGVLFQNFSGIHERAWLNPGRYLQHRTYCVVPYLGVPHKISSKQRYQLGSQGLEIYWDIAWYHDQWWWLISVFPFPCELIFSGLILNHEYTIDKNPHLSQCMKHNLIKYCTMMSGSTSVILLTKGLFIFRQIITAPSPWTWATSMLRITHKIFLVSLKTLNWTFLPVAFSMALKKPSQTYLNASFVAQLQYTRCDRGLGLESE